MINKTQSRKTRNSEIIELNKKGLCPHRKPVEEHCQECHWVYLEMTIEAMGDDYIGQEP